MFKYSKGDKVRFRKGFTLEEVYDLRCTPNISNADSLYLDMSADRLKMMADIATLLFAYLPFDITSRGGCYRLRSGKEVRMYYIKVPSSVPCSGMEWMFSEDWLIPDQQNEVIIEEEDEVTI